MSAPYLCLLIDDGFTLEGYIPPRKGVHGEVNFTYRLAPPKRVYEYGQEPRGTGQQMLNAVTKLLAELLVKWDVRDRQGNEVPITPAVLARVPVPVLEQMVNAVTGYGSAQREDDLKN